MIHPIDYYTLFRCRQEELLRRAAYERLMRAARDKQVPHHQIHRQLATWVGMYLRIVGQKLERYGAVAGMRDTSHASRHH